MNLLKHLKETFLYVTTRARFRKNSFPSVIETDWKALGLNRVALANVIGIKRGFKKYLEIGCFENELFDSVAIMKKVGVDPVKGGNVRLTSDQFFEKNQENFDLIFIDGLHEYSQVHRDAANALSALSEGGVILFHDMIPRTWREHHVPRVSRGDWTGDVWKLSFELAASSDLDFFVCNIDHGVGVLRKKVGNARLVDLSVELKDKQFDYFLRNRGAVRLLDWHETLAELQIDRP